MGYMTLVNKTGGHTRYPILGGYIETVTGCGGLCKKGGNKKTNTLKGGSGYAFNGKGLSGKASYDTYDGTGVVSPSSMGVGKNYTGLKSIQQGAGSVDETNQLGTARYGFKNLSQQ